jgi:bifunctional non-homologous end joining protein LigD
MADWAVKRKATLTVGGRELEVSKLDDVLFPNASFTKADLIDYYIRISDFILPHLRDRPLTLKMYHAAHDEKPEYHRNALPTTPDWIPTFGVPRKAGGPEVRYVLINSLPALVWAANWRNIEMHVFLAKAPRIEQPTVIVLDLDPGAPATLLDCAQVALSLRAMLSALKLKAFIKSSGGKGLHIYVPLNTPVTYDVTQRFAQVLAESLEKINPRLVTSTMAKSARAGKVFVDWSQNAAHKSTICVYSLRANGRPAVSMPLEWQEVESAIKNEDISRVVFEPEAAIKRCAQKGDLFAPLLKLKQRIPAKFEMEFEKIRERFAAAASAQAPPARGNGRLPTPARASRKPRTSGLAAYEAKRDFSRTSEPSGHAAPRPAAPDRERLFVIQKHAASHLHYDFRLEMEGVLRSWAVPKGPPLTRGEARLAMHVEDHPMDYARFEGIIPPGQYGGGTVMVWDIGTYRVREGTPSGAYYSGKLALELHGKKLKGDWALVRAGRQDEKGKERWLLIKGHADARPISRKRDDTSALTGRSMEQIAHNKKSAQWNSLAALPAKGYK